MADIVSFWLVPTYDTRVWFTGHIDRLAERFGTAKFEPHLTVHAGPADQVATPASVLAESAFEFEPITLRPVLLAHSSEFTKTLYVEFHLEQALIDLSIKLRDRVPSDYVLKPHMSLLYHHLTEDEREELMQTIRLPDENVRFEVIQAVKCPAIHQTADDVRSWQILEEWRL